MIRKQHQPTAALIVNQHKKCLRFRGKTFQGRQLSARAEGQPCKLRFRPSPIARPRLLSQPLNPSRPSSVLQPATRYLPCMIRHTLQYRRPTDCNSHPSALRFRDWRHRFWQLPSWFSPESEGSLITAGTGKAPC
jgi:hypothetical protein